MTEMFGEAWSPMSVPDLAPDDDDEGYWFDQCSNTNFSPHDVLKVIILSGVLSYQISLFLKLFNLREGSREREW